MLIKSLLDLMGVYQFRGTLRLVISMAPGGELSLTILGVDCADRYAGTAASIGMEGTRP